MPAESVAYVNLRLTDIKPVMAALEAAAAVVRAAERDRCATPELAALRTALTELANVQAADAR